MYQDNRKLGKRHYITVTQSGMIEPTRRLGGDGDIFTVYQYFTYRLRHKKGSNRPAGWFHSMWGGSDYTVEVRWLYTDDHNYFAPEISFRPTEAGIKLATKVAKALHEMRNTRDESPERLTADLKAYLVEYVNDNKDGCWDDYRVLQAPGDCPMMVIARHAS